MAKRTVPEPPKRMGRPPKGDAAMGGAIHLRLPAEQLAALDRAVELERARTGYPVSRTDVARRVLEEWLRAQGAA